MNTLLVLIIATILCAILGILSIYRPNIIGAEFYWAKNKYFYVPKYKKPTNEYYLNYIKTLGLGFILSAVYVFNPSIL